MSSELVRAGLEPRLALTSSRALALGLGAAILLVSPLASAEDETAEPTQYEVVGEPIDEPAPATADPNAAGQPVTPPPTYTPTQPGAAQGYGQPQPATAQTAAPPPPTPFATGFSGGVFGSFSPTGRIVDLDTSGGFVGDLERMAGFGGYIAGLGRWVGGGAQIRASWFLDTPDDVSWSIIDASGMFRFRWRHKIFEIYGEVTGGFSIQRISSPSTVVGDDTAGGVNFGLAPGFRIFATDTLSFFVEPAVVWRAMFGNFNAIGMRQFVLEFGIGFGA